MAALTLEPYDIKYVYQNDHERILAFLSRFFYRDEPMNNYLKVVQPDGTCPLLDKYCSNSLSNDISVMAVTHSGQLIGVSVNKIKRRGVLDDYGKIEDPNFLKILGFYGRVFAESDVFGKYPDIDSLMMVDVLSVDPAYRGQGVATKLIDATREIAKRKSVPLLRADCTSSFTAKATARLGFECIYRIKFKDYLEDGQPVIQPEAPHDEFRMYVQRIDS